MSQYINLWNIQRIDDKTFELSLNAQFITMTGAVVNSDLEIPFAFRLLRMDFKQTSSSDVDSSQSLNYSIQYKKFNKFIELINSTAVAVSISLDWEERYKFLATTLRLALNGVNTNRIYPVVTIEKV